MLSLHLLSEDQIHFFFYSAKEKKKTETKKTFSRFLALTGHSDKTKQETNGGKLASMCRRVFKKKNIFGYLCHHHQLYISITVKAPSEKMRRGFRKGHSDVKTYLAWVYFLKRTAGQRRPGRNLQIQESRVSNRVRAS